MKKALIVSFDLIRSSEVSTSLSVASIIAYLKNDPRCGEEFDVDVFQYNMLQIKHKLSNDVCALLLSAHNLLQYDTIALPAYVWNEYLINELIRKIRQAGFIGKIVLGGYQVTYSSRETLESDYSSVDFYISGYAEASLLKAILSEKPDKPIVLNESIPFENIPSVYLSKAIPLSQNQKMIRYETKRGCPYRCSFCAHRDLQNGRVYKHMLEKIFQELALFKEKSVQKINVLDPVFNAGSDHLEILKEIERLELKSLFTFQTRFELIKHERGKEFLELVSGINAHLELGLQTINEQEYAVIQRPNNKALIKEAMHMIQQLQVSYEVSIIYGLPNQTVDSFKRTIDFLVENGCRNIKAYPLMLLKGTELYHDKSKWKLEERAIGEFNIPVVISSNSFTEHDWQTMNEMAVQLNPAERF